MDKQCSDVNPFEDGTALDALRGLSSFEEAFSRLSYLAEHGRPCGIVRGPSGSGKTPLLHCVLRELRRGGQECGFLDLRRSSVEEFAWQVACELGTAPAVVDNRRGWCLVEDAVQGRALASRATVIVLDHLGEQGTELHSHLERLLAIAESSAGWCTVLGAARSDISTVDHFVRDHSELRIELEPLNLDETGSFLDRVVSLSGCFPFTGEAAGAMHEYSQGSLRRLMTLGRLAMLAQSAEEAPQVTAEIVRLVAAEVSPRTLPRKLANQTAVLATVD